MKPWKTLSRRTILDHSKWLRVEEHSIELPGGRIINDWPWIVTPDYVNIAVVTDEGMFVCFRQTKYAVDGVALAPIGGYLEPGEEPLECARRELAEETGYEAARWQSLGVFPADGNHGAGTAHLFLATGARHVKDTVSDDLEEQELVLLSRDDVARALQAGEFKVLSWTTAIALSLLRLPPEQK